MKNRIHLYLIRHGETYLNRYKRMQGWADSPLTEEGKLVAIECGNRLSDIQFDRVYTSDSGRTVETAELILQKNSYEIPVIRKTKAFRESFFGSFEGEFSAVALGKVANDHGYTSFRELLRNRSLEDITNFIKESDPYHHAESYSELWDRIEKGLNELIIENNKNDENVLIVTHGNTIRNIVTKFSEEFNIELEIKNASITILEYSSDTYKVISFNQ
ncbi:histidine phosphatase family protein [Bacillus sp. AFS001701]|uniref:histidine phosphatase family protein n=1 Tax=Bacillaceae TaxID=186817 RepID=UPI000BF39303|nr:histidine phosphatase family protein [Bacillus sp. AFS001701]PET55608.1 histidine phosphatase family protein [Bacillus sp. AFS001701]